MEFAKVKKNVFTTFVRAVKRLSYPMGLIVCTLFVASFRPMMAQSGFYKLKYGVLNESEAFVESCPTQLGGRVEIPERVKIKGVEYVVTHVGTDFFHGFKDCRGITEVRLPSSITSLKSEVFSGCVRLKKINLPSSIQEIDYGAFMNCEILDSVVIPQNLSEISFNTFYGCKKLKYVQIPLTVKYLGDKAFMQCESLLEIQLPIFLIKIEKYAFSNCVSLKSIVFPNTLTSVGEGAFQNCSSIEELVFPESLVSIGKGAFSFCKSLKRIDFSNCSYSSFSISSQSFENCEQLVSVIGLNTSVPSFLFKNCKKLQSIDFGPNVKSIMPSAFEGTSVEEFFIPSSVSFGPEYSDEYNQWINLKSIRVDSQNKKFSSEDGVLYNKDKTILLRFPVGKELDEFVLPKSVKKIENYAFAGCIHLKKIVLPSNFSNFGGNAFFNCPNLVIERK